MIFNSPSQFIEQVKIAQPVFRLMALDLGQRKIGVAIMNSVVPIAVPFKVVMRSTLKSDIAEILKLIKNEKIDGLIIGLPFQMDGTENAQTKKVQVFANKVIESSEIPVIFEDERMTTKLANTMLGQAGLNRKERAAVDDKVAAQLILESFLKRLLNLIRS